MKVNKMKFKKPTLPLHAPTPHLYVANCGPALNLNLSQIIQTFSLHGRVVDASLVDDSGSRVVVSFERAEDAQAARDVWHRKPCLPLHGIVMFIEFAVPRKEPMVKHLEPVLFQASDIDIPGLFLRAEFISLEQEKELLDIVDQMPWQTLAKRRVQHYGYEFLYKVRNVDLTKKQGELPTFVDHVLEKITALPEITNAAESSLPFDQLTVNEYPRGVGLSPHVDTHSAFEGSIVSLSLAGPCVMEFRKYHSCENDFGKMESNYPAEVGRIHQTDLDLDFEARQNIAVLHQNLLSTEQKMTKPTEMKVERRILYLPERSLLILSDEARYGWHHYIPHHKEDFINGERILRSSRRVSFTFRKVRIGPCNCRFPHLCDSQIKGAACTIEIRSHDDHDPTVSGTNSNNYTSVEINEAQDEVHNRVPRMANDLTPDVSSRISLNCDTINEGKPFQSSRGTCEEQENNVGKMQKVWIPATPEIEKKYVMEVYDAIAPHFSSTRIAKWPKVAQFLHSIAPASVIADAGCGNGKYLGLNQHCFCVGCDISAPLVAICAERGHEVLVADALLLPYRTGFCDAAISIAVLHHLSSEQRRVRAIQELLRVVRRGGKVLITVWAVEQEDKAMLKKWTPLTNKYMEECVGTTSFKSKGNISGYPLHRIQEVDALEHGSAGEHEPMACSRQTFRGEEDAKEYREQQEYLVPWHLPFYRAEIGGVSAKAIAHGFARKDDKKGAVIYGRYYHVFMEGELERLISKCTESAVVDCFYDKSNWCVVIEKL